MKPLAAALGLLVCGPLTAAPDPPHRAWRWEQTVAVPAPGMVRLVVPDATLNEARPNLADLRVISPEGVETPWLLDNAPPPKPSVLEVREPVVRLIEAAPDIEAATVIEFATGTGEPVAAATLRSPAREFIKSATVDGSADGENWQPVSAREVVFRQANGAERMRLPLPPKPWRKLRLTLSDARSMPIPVTGVVLELSVSARRETETRDISVRQAVPGAPGTTRLDLNLGAANLHLNAIALQVGSPVFSRRFTLAMPDTDRDNLSQPLTLATGMIYRVTDGQGTTTEELTLPLNRRVSSRQLILTLEDGDSPPLAVESAAQATVFPTLLEFHAANAGTWRLLFGNPQAAMPSYDLGPLRAALAGTPGLRLSPGTPQARPDYEAPAALPGIEPAGAAIDLSAWTRRCAVQLPGTGAVAIELKPAQLAAARDDLGDLRLVQNDRQLPYLIEQRTIERTLPCALAPAEPDPGHPAISHWTLHPPVPGLPIAALLLSSPDPMFSRTLALAVGRRTQRRPFGTGWSATWTRANGDQSDFRFELGHARMPERIELETDNGDNPPLALDAARVIYQTRVLAAKIVSAEPVFLYYGNPQASAPSYDLDLVRAELLAADKHQAALGSEEILKPDSAAKPWRVTAGSPWLWAALALVVVVLLMVVAKLLPKPAAGTG
jgi:hypothetical protein